MSELNDFTVLSGWCFFFFQAEDGIRDYKVTGVQTCALPILSLAGIAYTLWMLRAANRNLERRVQERTHELAGSEERFRTLCMASPIGIYMTDEIGRAHV